MRNASSAFQNSNPSPEKGSGFEEVRNRFLLQYRRISTIDLLLEYEERIRVFREFGYYGEAKILEDGKRIWNDLLPQIGEERFREELVMTLALAFHSSFVIISKKGVKNPKDAAQIQADIRRTSTSLLEQ